MRAALAAAALFVALAPAAHAQSTATTRTFDDRPSGTSPTDAYPDVEITDACQEPGIFADPDPAAAAGDQAAQASCSPFLIDFAED